jgi:hypothetical protein
MLRSTIGRVSLAFGVIALAGSSASAQPRHNDNKPSTLPQVNVAKWDWSVYDENDRVFEKGNFVARGYAIFKNNQRTGTYEDISPTQVRVEMTGSRLKGKIDLFKEAGSDVNWKGELAKPGGGKYKIVVVLEKVKS